MTAPEESGTVVVNLPSQSFYSTSFEYQCINPRYQRRNIRRKIECQGNERMLRIS